MGEGEGGGRQMLQGTENVIKAIVPFIKCFCFLHVLNYIQKDFDLVFIWL